MAVNVAPAYARPPVANPDVSRWNSLARAHLLVGAMTLIAFLLSGAYMALHRPPLGALEPGLHMTFISRHIYMLAAALMNLVLGSYLRPTATRSARSAQWIGSLLLMLSAGLLLAAFVGEPVAGRYRTPISALGLYSLFAGSLLHVGAAHPDNGSVSSWQLFLPAATADP
jgi:hypothetical protein